MKNRGKNLVMLAVGILLGITMAGPVAQAAEEAYLRAFPSTQTFYVDGKQVTLETYGINGYNYVKLRDIGQAVGFNVYYDAQKNAGMMESDKPYTGQPPTASVKQDAPTSVDYASKANLTAFTSDLTPEVYNAIRHSIENRELILAGKAQPIPFNASKAATDQLYAMVPTLGLYPDCSLSWASDGKLVCDVRQLEVYDPALKHTEGFFKSISSLSQQKQIEAIVWYVCDRLSYAVQYPFVDEVLAQDGELKGACASYAYCVQFLCDRAGIPCILVTSPTHQWNRVYIDGSWWDVDATGDDVPDLTLRSQVTILHPLGEKVVGMYEDAAPASTAFAMELRVPGSTK